MIRRFFEALFIHAAFCCALPISMASAQTSAAISGRVLDSTGGALPGALLKITGPSGQTRETAAGPDGSFRIEGLEPGAYRLGASSRGLSEEARDLLLSAGQVLTLTITLRPSVLPQSVEVVASVESVSGTVTKMDVPLLETPQAITVIPRTQIEQQSPLSFQEALRYAAGVSTDSYGFDGRGDWAVIRGSEEWGQYLNGLKMLFGYYNNVRPDPYTLERIEVMRGPSSVLFGQSGFGGVVNLVSKRPLAEHHSEIQVQLGSYRRRQIALDLTGPMDGRGRWLYRLVGLARDSNTQVDHVPDNRLLVAPSLTWRPRAGTSFTVLTNFQQDRSGSSLGFFPWQGTLLPNPMGQIPTNTFISEPGFDEYRTGQAAIGYLFQHQLNNRWTIRQNLNYSDSKASYQSLWSSFNPRPVLNPDNRTINRDIYVSKPRARSPVVDTQAETRFATGALRHNMLFGVDYQKAVINQRWGMDQAPPIDVFAPHYGNYTVPPLTTYPEERQDQLGMYAQDHIQFREHWSAMLSIRRDRANSKLQDDPASRNRDTAVTGRAGVVYQSHSGLAPYFSYSQSFQPLAGADIYNRPYKPVRARQWEMGAKYQPGAGQNLITAAAFHINEQNRLTPDSQNPLNSIQIGEARVRGFELESRTQPFQRLSVIANYTFLDARVSRSNGSDLGKRLPIVPRHFASLWGVQSFRTPRLAGTLSVGGGIRYTGSSFDGGDMLRTPAYTLYDLMFAYERPAWRISLNAANVTDKVYIASCLARGDCFYGFRRAITATIRFRY